MSLFKCGGWRFLVGGWWFLVYDLKFIGGMHGSGRRSGPKEAHAGNLMAVLARL